MKTRTLNALALAAVIAATLAVGLVAQPPVPNRFDVVQQVYARGGWDLTTHDGDGRFTEAVVSALHAADANFGHLKKSGAQNQFNGHAVDATLYRGAWWSVDFIASSESPDARIAWTPDSQARYSLADWFAPADAPPPTPIPVPVPAPTCPSVDNSAVLAKLAQLEAKLDALAAKPAPLVVFPIYRTSFWGGTLVLRPDPAVK